MQETSSRAQHRSPKQHFRSGTWLCIPPTAWASDWDREARPGGSVNLSTCSRSSTPGLKVMIPVTATAQVGLRT